MAGAPSAGQWRPAVGLGSGGAHDDVVVVTRDGRGGAVMTRVAGGGGGGWRWADVAGLGPNRTQR